MILLPCPAISDALTGGTRGPSAARSEDRAADISDRGQRPRWRAWLACICVPACCLLLSGLAAAAAAPVTPQDERPDTAELPTLAQMQLPTAAELRDADLKDRAYDWIVLKTNQAVIVCNPLFPRPDTLQKMAEERSQLEATRPTTPEAREQRSRRLEELSRLTITLPGDAVTEYRLPLGQIEQIILFEDLILQRVDRLLEEGEIREAYDLVLSVEREIPNWEKTRPRFERLLLTESRLKAEAGDIYAALALLDELAGLNINNPELQPRFGDIVGGMIETAVQQQEYRKARFLIGRIERHFPEHPVAQSWRNQISGLASQKLSEAVQQAQQKRPAEAADLARQAEQIWPLTGNARAAYSQLVSRHQVLRVAVEAFSDSRQVFPAETDADSRHLELLQVPLFEASAVDELTYYRSSFFERWDPYDLGRELVLTLRDTRPHWQTQPVLTASQIADALSAQLDPAGPLYNARLASFVSEFSVRSPTELKLRFSRVPLSLEALLRFPVTQPGGPAAPPEQSIDAASGPQVLSTRFELVTAEPQQRIYRRRLPEPDGLDNAQYHVAEIAETLYPDRHHAVQALLRGEADYLPRVLPWEIDAFLAAKTLVARKRALPVSHVITFNPQSKNISSAQMRRALSLAVDRESILKSVVLQDPAMKHGRPTSAVWRQSSYATNPLEQAPPYDIRLAYALRFAAERQLQIAELQKLESAAKAAAKAAGQEFSSDEFRAATKVDHIKLPALKMVVEPDEAAMAAAERILVYWNLIGFNVTLIPGGQAGERLADGDWDLMYRRLRMEEPLLDLWPLLTNDPHVGVERLEGFPDWMRQELINLDYAGSFVDAQNRLFTMHRHLAAQAFVIPLWEIDDYVVFQKTVAGFLNQPVSVYHNVERWTVRP